MKRFALYSSGLLIIGVVLFFLFHHQETGNCIVTELHEVSMSGLPDCDRPELAQQWEFQRTMDPAVGSVPKERLLKAYSYAEQVRKQTKKSHAAISGMVWQERGPNNIGGRTAAILVDPNDATNKSVFAAGVDGGLWHTSDITVASPVWTANNDFFADMAITTIACNPAASKLIMYFGTGEGWWNVDAIRGNGIWKSTDGGVTWNQLAATTGNNNFDFVQKIQVDAAGNVYAATRGTFCNTGGLYKSTNAGVTWTLVLGNQASCATADCWADDIEIAADGTLYASMSGELQSLFTGSGIGGEIWKSATGNAGSWSQLNIAGSGFPLSNTNVLNNISIGCAPSDKNTIYALTQATAGNQGFYKMYKSVNAGVTWATLPAVSWQDQCGAGAADFTRNQAWYDLSVAVDPTTANTVWIGGVDLMRSTNGGTSFTQMTDWSGGCYQFVHADQHTIVYAPGGNTTMYFGNDGGIYATTNAIAVTPTLTSKNNSYNVTQFYSVAVHPTAASNYFLCGAQDNGNQKFTVAGINPTVDQTGGDGAFCHIDQLNPTYQFCAYVEGNFYVSQNSGATWVYHGFGAGGQFIDPTDFDNNAKILYFGWSAGQYGRFMNPEAVGGNTAATNAIALFGGGSVTAVTVSPNNANRVWFGIDNGRVVRVDAANTAGPLAANLSAGLPSGASPNFGPSCICVQKGNENHILVTYSNYGLTHVLESANGGTTWTSDVGNLPDMPVWWAIFNPNNTTQALLGTDVGVWTTTSLSGAATVWGPSNGGLANASVHQLQVRASDQLIAAATHGRGLFTTDGSALPVRMLSFTGLSNEGNNVLNWATASEINNDRFEVERSADGESFGPIGSVKGSGTASFPHYYSFIDDNVVADLYYYRLKQIDYDGNYQYSDVIALNSKPSNILSVFPNPFSNEITIRFASSPVSQITVNIYDLTGRMVYTYNESTLSETELNLNLASQNLSKGVYFLNVITGNTNSTYKVIKI